MNSDDEESASRSSPIGNALRSKSKVVATGFLATMVFVGTIGAEVYENVNLHGIKEGTNSVTDLERTLLRDQNTLTQLNLKEESIRSSEEMIIIYHSFLERTSSELFIFLRKRSEVFNLHEDTSK